jgi:uncharacterized protein with HEPN domain
MSIDRGIEYFIIDVLLSVEKIRRYSSNIFDAHDLMVKDKEFDAILRSFEILSEALWHILRDSTLAEFVNPEWRVIKGVRNIIVHEYFGINYNELFKIIKKDLSTFEVEFLDFIKNFVNQEDYLDRWCKAVKTVYSELMVFGRIESSEFLLQVNKKVCS